MVFKLFGTLAVLALALAVTVVDGYGTGAGTCVAGGGAIAKAGAGHASGGTTGKKGESGPLSKRGTTFAINGITVKGGESFKTGVTLKWTLKTTDTTYGMRGILIRITHSGGDSYTFDSTQLKDSTLCTGTGVNGLTHKDAKVKKSVNGNLRFDKPGSVTVDITVVYRNSKTLSYHGYSQYKFTIKSATAPVKAPVRSPIRRPA